MDTTHLDDKDLLHEFHYSTVYKHSILSFHVPTLIYTFAYTVKSFLSNSRIIFFIKLIEYYFVSSQKSMDNFSKFNTHNNDIYH